MSFFGASSSVGGGGFRFNAPSSSRVYGSSMTSSSSSATVTGGVTLSTAPDAPPLTMQILQKSTRPKLQMLFSQVNSCRSRAATVVKGSTSQKQFNAQYTSLIPLLGSVIKDLDEELFFVVEAQNMAAAASSVSGVGGGGVERLDPKKVPTSVTIHSVTKDLAAFVTSIKGCSLNVPYLDLISKAAIAAVVEKETAHEKANAAKSSKEALKKEKERAAAAIAAASASATSALGGSALSSSGTTSALPNSILVGGLPSPLQKPLTAALHEHSNTSNSSNANIGGGIALFPSAASASAAGGSSTTSTNAGSGGLPALLQENRALLQAVQPWLIPYPFSHGVKTERVQSSKSSHAKVQRIGFAVNTFLKKHPELAATILEKVPPNILQQYARTAQPPNFSNPPHTAHNNPHNNNTISMNTTAGHGGAGMSPSIAPSNANTPNAVEIAASLPAELLLQYILSYSGFSRADLYSLAPKILEICACPTAHEMLTKWEQREAVFDILLNAPSVGAENLGQPSSINHQNSQQQQTLSGQPANDQQKSANDEEDGEDRVNIAPSPSSCPQLSLAMRTAQLSSIDNNELFLGSPNLKPCGGATSGGLVPANASGSAVIGAMTPLMLGGNGYDQDEVEDGDTLAPLILEKAYEDDNQNDSNSSERLKEYGFPNNNNNSGYGTATALSAPPPTSKRIGGGRGFFPHRCSNPALLDKAAFITYSGTGANNDQGCSEPLSQHHGGGRLSHSNVMGSSMYGSHSYAAVGKKRGREADDGFSPRASGGSGLGMFDVSPLLSGSDPLLGDANDLFLSIGASPPGTPQPPGGGKATRYSGGSEGHRGGRGGHPHTEHPHPHSLPPPASTAPTANINTTIPSDPSLIEPQPLLSVSDRVMACLLHFGVVTTEMPMLAAEATVGGAVGVGTAPHARKETAKVR